MKLYSINSNKEGYCNRVTMSKDNFLHDDVRSTDLTNLMDELYPMYIVIVGTSVHSGFLGNIEGRSTDQTRRVGHSITVNVEGRSLDQTGYANQGT